MTTHGISIVLELTQEEAEVWKGRFACVGAMSLQEWKDLFMFFQTIDGFLSQLAPPMAEMAQAAAEGKAPPDGTFRKIVALAEDAKGAATLMPAIQFLMSRFAMVANGKTKKERLQ